MSEFKVEAHVRVGTEVVGGKAYVLSKAMLCVGTKCTVIDYSEPKHTFRKKHVSKDAMLGFRRTLQAKGMI